jgi:hypothetical protein
MVSCAIAMSDTCSTMKKSIQEHVAWRSSIFESMWTFLMYIKAFTKSNGRYSRMSWAGSEDIVSVNTGVAKPVAAIFELGIMCLRQIQNEFLPRSVIHSSCPKSVQSVYSVSLFRTSGKSVYTHLALYLYRTRLIFPPSPTPLHQSQLHTARSTRLRINEKRLAPNHLSPSLPAIFPHHPPLNPSLYPSLPSTPLNRPSSH